MLHGRPHLSPWQSVNTDHTHWGRRCWTHTHTSALGKHGDCLDKSNKSFVLSSIRSLRKNSHGKLIVNLISKLNERKENKLRALMHIFQFKYINSITQTINLSYCLLKDTSLIENVGRLSSQNAKWLAAIRFEHL